MLDENEIARIVVDESVKMHRELGPGLFESVYETILARQLLMRGATVERQVDVPIVYLNYHFKAGFRADLVVDKKVIVELKCVKQIAKAHQMQLLTYLRLSNLRLGLLLNFGEVRMKDGIQRIVNGL